MAGLLREIKFAWIGWRWPSNPICTTLRPSARSARASCPIEPEVGDRGSHAALVHPEGAGIQRHRAGGGRDAQGRQRVADRTAIDLLRERPLVLGNAHLP